MSEPYLGEIRLFSGPYAPSGWALCNGQSLSISQYETLYQLLGTTYGGDGINTFNLPNLQGSVAVHAGISSGGTYIQGQFSGETQHTLLAQEMAQHSHLAAPSFVVTPVLATDAAKTNAPGATTLLAMATKANAAAPIYIDPTAAPTTATTLPLYAFGSTDITGGSLPHDNMQPYLAVTFIIALYGVFPSRN